MAGSDDLTPVEVRPTIAEGASIEKPVRAREVLAAVRRSGGATVAVSEAEIEGALFELSRIGLYAEPTSALAAAAFTKLSEAAGSTHRDDRARPDRLRPEGDTANRRAHGRRADMQ